ncbi:MAG: hypothetical protein AMXMBFR23_05170 [Chloroflexota bacterium]
MTTARTSIEISAPDAHAAVTAGTGVVVDVREDWEWSSGHAADAKHISLYGLGARLKELPRDRSIFCICASGNRSLSAAEYLRREGFDARSVAGGTAAWVLHRLPVEA